MHPTMGPIGANTYNKKIVFFPSTLNEQDIGSQAATVAHEAFHYALGRMREHGAYANKLDAISGISFVKRTHSEEERAVDYEAGAQGLVKEAVPNCFTCTAYGGKQGNDGLGFTGWNRQ